MKTSRRESVSWVRIPPSPPFQQIIARLYSFNKSKMSHTRKNIKKSDAISVYFREAWTCRYCDHAVFFSPSLLILEQMNPGHGYYHAHNKREAMIDVFIKRWASIDHITPVASGGVNSLDNYMTVCWDCNNRFNSQHPKNKKIKPINIINKDMQWDGLSGIYVKYGLDQTWKSLILAHQNINHN